MGDEIETRLGQLEILATGQNVWPLIARTLRISKISGSQLTAATAVARRMEELPCPTLQSLKNIRTPTDTDEAKSIVMDFLRIIDRSEEFTLVDDSYTNAHYALLDVESSNLRRLSFPAKTRIALNGSFSRRWPATLNWTGMIVRKSPHLEHLVLPTSDAWSEMCPILQSAGIHLKQISGACVTQELLAYLASYSGLESLKIQSAAGKEALAYPFFDTLLSHKHSLLSLQCPAYYEGEWCLKPYNLAIISQLHAMQHLEMNVNSYDIGSNSNIITTFIDLTPTIPALRSICLRAVPSVIAMLGTCGRNRMTALRYRQIRIDNALNKYSESTDSNSVRALIETHHELVPPSTYWQ
ncbi:hypothetical protein B0H19DRAFT_1253588 [Mycena capillaripes]|nr:hypothetical protein B0H19DRAFT_1253588 [Mycena capillaripes]